MNFIVLTEGSTRRIMPVIGLYDELTANVLFSAVKSHPHPLISVLQGKLEQYYNERATPVADLMGSHGGFSFEPENCV